jgi:membrane protein
MAWPSFVRFFCHLNWHTLTRTVTKIIENRLLGLAAEIAFHSMLSLFPAILAMFTAIALYAEAVHKTFIQLATQLSQFIPHEAWVIISDFASKEIAQSKNNNLFSFSFAIAIWTASGAVSTSMVALDKIQQTPTKQKRSFWQAKLVSLGLTISNILLLMLACFLVFISDLFLGVLVEGNNSLEFLRQIWQLLLWPVALAIVAGAFSFIYLYGPSVWQFGTPLLPGAILGAIFWALVSALFRLYVTNFGNYNKVYGTVGTFIILMLWLWMSAFILLVGHQLNVTIGEDMRTKATNLAKNSIIKSRQQKKI